MQKDLLADFLHLCHCFGNRGSTLLPLLEYFDNNPSRICQSSRSELRAIGLRPKAISSILAPPDSRVTRDLAWARDDHNHLICHDDNAYPALLRQISDFPPLLYASGDISLLQDPQIAIVGSRLCTPGGAHNAFDFGARLAEAGLVITSGMALGIDAEAHRGALASGGKTLAVQGTGLDIVYPSRNRRLAAEIQQQGLLVSEFALGTGAHKSNFPRRNRIISGLSLATLVVEATQRSGSLITARLAADQGREVFALPGSIHNPQARGCHALIRDGAQLAETPQNLTRELSQLASFVFSERDGPPARESDRLDSAQQQLLQAIGYDPVNCDILVQRSGLTIEQLSSMLLVLELNDLIQSAPGGCYVRI